MKFFKRALLFLAITFIVIQFFRPQKNISAAPSTNHISQKFSVPDDVKQILATSCYDCHSNNTHYPWYFSVQPVAWWLSDHINEGKKHLNFDEFTSYPLQRQFNKFKQTAEEVEEDGMPLSSYLAIHGDAAISPEQKEKIIAWCDECRNAMKAMYPADSLKKQ